MIANLRCCSSSRPGWLADRFHPLRVYLFASIWDMLGTVAALRLDLHTTSATAGT